MSNSSSLPPGWITKHSETHNREYYFNTQTSESTWTRPTVASNSDAPTQVRASHILCKHAGSRRPASWRNPNITISKQEALNEITHIRNEIVSGRASFDEIAKKRSDCSSASHNGDLGFFERGKMQIPFEDAAFSLKVGELSGIVDTDSGVHIILRTA